MKSLTVIFLLLSLISQGQWQLQTFANKASFRSIDRLDASTVWISGSKGSILKSSDGGKNWENVCPKEFVDFDFRGIAILNKEEVVAMSSGDGLENKAFCIKTLDGGRTWKVVLRKTERGVFFDTIKFKDNKTGYILGDAIDNKPYLLKTIDGGNTWYRVENLPDILVGEASFAASNSCISLFQNQIWFNTQNRVFHSKNSGKTWSVVETPFETAQSRGIFGTFFWDKNRGILVGGDYTDDKNETLQCAFSQNAGKQWQTKTEFYQKGLTECISKLKNGNILSVGTSGTRTSKDNGITWKNLDKESFHVVSCHGESCIAAGGNGRIGIWSL